jgi:hypothetical protein
VDPGRVLLRPSETAAVPVQANHSVELFGRPTVTSGFKVKKSEETSIRPL